MKLYFIIIFVAFYRMFMKLDRLMDFFIDGQREVILGCWILLLTQWTKSCNLLDKMWTL